MHGQPPNPGNTARDDKCLDAAIGDCLREVAAKPTSPAAHNNLGIALRDRGRLDEAIAAFRQALALDPNSPQPHNNLGTALRDQGQLSEAIAAFRDAIALNPNLAEVHNNLAMALGDQGRLDEAIIAHREAIAIKPSFAKAHYNLGMALLTRGEFEQGWKEYEWRWKCKGVPLLLKNFSQPQWDGSPLNGRTILLHTEQGLGDAIKFIRYVPLVAERGGKIVIVCFPELQKLFRSMPGNWRIVSPAQPFPVFDVHSPLLSLPRVLGTTLSNIPSAVPYLSGDAEKVRSWQHRLASHSPKLNVGLVWAGRPTQRNDRNRSVKLATFAPLGRIPGVRFFSLQKGEAASQTKAPSTPLELIDWTQELNDFEDTAALIANLDLVISVDTAVAHLAGAMGKPIWTLLSSVPGWHWLLEREDSPWYPSMRLFRQTTRGDWDSVITRVAEALSLWIKNHR
jgi:hypothetical protein